MIPHISKTLRERTARIPLTYKNSRGFVGKYFSQVILLATVTIRLNYRQVVFLSTRDFLLVYTQDGLPELGSSFKEIFLVALFKKNPKFIVFPLDLYSEFTGLLESLLRKYI